MFSRTVKFALMLSTLVALMGTVACDAGGGGDNSNVPADHTTNHGGVPHKPGASGCNSCHNGSSAPACSECH